MSKRQGGHRRIDRVLAPEYGQNLSELSLPEVKGRRDESLAEREYQPLRPGVLKSRLLQRGTHGDDGAVPILSIPAIQRFSQPLPSYRSRAEQTRRAAGEEEGSLVENVISALAADGPSGGPSRGEALRLTIPPEEMALARRRVEQLVADTSISDPRSLTDEELEEAAAKLSEEEGKVSSDRSAVIAVHDLLQAELKRRYKKDPSEALAP